MRQIIEGVEYMHGKYIMHLDMKPENVLCVTRTGNRIKLIDFGLARRFDPSHKLQVMFGTPDFAAPEVLSYERVTPASDMWSVGVICYVLLSGLSPFMGNSDLETMTNVTRAIYDFDDESFDPISSDAKEFISRLLIKDPNRRLTPSQSLQHKWLAKTPVKKGKVTKLSKTKLKKYVVRRRWQKAVTAIMALTRMGANLSLAGAFGGSATGDRNKTTTTMSSSSSKKSSTATSTTSTTSSTANRSNYSTSGARSPAAPTVVPSNRFSSSTITSKTSSSTSTRTPTTTTTITSRAADPTGRLGPANAASSSSYRVTSSTSTSSSSTTRRRY